MDNVPDMSPEELEKLVEKAKAELQAKLDRMTPEERAQAELKAQKMIEADNARMQKIIDDAKKIISDTAPAPKFCSNCGAPAGGGNFCEYCGNPLRKTTG